MQLTYTTEPIPLVLADGLERGLRYSMSARKRIKAKWGNELDDMLKQPVEDFLPAVLYEGLVDKTGVSEQVLADSLLIGPAVDYALLQFVEAFFGRRQRDVIESVDETRRALLQKNLNQIAEKIMGPMAPSQPVQ